MKRASSITIGARRHSSRTAPRSRNTAKRCSAAKRAWRKGTQARTMARRMPPRSVTRTWPGFVVSRSEEKRIVGTRSQRNAPRNPRKPSEKSFPGRMASMTSARASEAVLQAVPERMAQRSRRPFRTGLKKEEKRPPENNAAIRWKPMRRDAATRTAAQVRAEGPSESTRAASAAACVTRRMMSSQSQVPITIPPSRGRAPANGMPSRSRPERTTRPSASSMVPRARRLTIGIAARIANRRRRLANPTPTVTSHPAARNG